MAIGSTGLIPLNFIYACLPVALHNFLLRLGIGFYINQLVLQTLCVPFEFLLHVQPMASAGMGAAVLVIGIDVLKFYFEQLR